jgi:hypothetical protein
MALHGMEHGAGQKNPTICITAIDKAFSVWVLLSLCHATSDTVLELFCHGRWRLGASGSVWEAVELVQLDRPTPLKLVTKISPPPSFLDGGACPGPTPMPLLPLPCQPVSGVYVVRCTEHWLQFASLLYWAAAESKVGSFLLCCTVQCLCSPSPVVIFISGSIPQ